MSFRLCLLFQLLALGVAEGGVRWITSPDIQWAVPEAPVLAISAVHSEPTCEEKITVAPEGVWLATGGEFDVFVWHMPECTVNALAASCIQEEKPLYHLNFSQHVRVLQAMDDGFLAVASGVNVTFWNFNTSTAVGSLPHSRDVVAMKVEDDWILTGTEDGSMHMWHPQGSWQANKEYTTELLQWSYSISYTLPELAYEITAVALCIGNHWLAAGVWEPETLTGRAMVWNSDFARIPEKVTRSYSEISRILSIEFSPEKTWLVTGTESGMVSSWRHVEHQDLPLQRRSAVWPVRALTFSANGHWLVGGDGEGNAKVWPTSSGLHGAFVATSVDLKGKGTE
eukprot:symbB.v1.2.037253.t1/scaffold5448.1/size27039/2